MEPQRIIHLFEEDGARYAIDTETCFCFQCDEISWGVLRLYPQTPVNRIYHLLADKHPITELEEVVGELEWLRATKAILRAPSKDDFTKQLAFEGGLRRLVVCLSRKGAETVQKRKGWLGRGARVTSNTAREAGRDAVGLLLNRSRTQRQLSIEFLEPQSVHNPALIAELCTYALRQGRLAGKEVTASVWVTDLDLGDVPGPLKGHALAARLDITNPERAGDLVTALNRAAGNLSRLVKALDPGVEGVSGRVIVTPRHPEFGNAVKTLRKIGFSTIELDMDGAFVENPQLPPADMLAGLKQTAVSYAQKLLQHRYFRLDPIAALFNRIYDGKPLIRADGAGTNEMAVSEDGGIYPSARMLDMPDMRIGSLEEGIIDEDKRAPFDAVGSATTGACRRCWARNLCGGGDTAVHQTLSGSFRRPHEPWCDMQRAWIASAVSAFNLLSSQGVNFTRVYGSLGQSFKPGLFTMVRAAFRMSIGMRPIEEADAEMLRDWENWNEASYFLANESGVFSATQYDRQMDAIHPEGVDFEMILIRKNGAPIGLVKLRPQKLPGTARGWVYLHNDADYADADVRKGFRAIIKEAGGQQSLRRVTVPAAGYESGLQGFLEAVGFARECTLREALYLHSRYHDVHLYAMCVEDL